MSRYMIIYLHTCYIHIISRYPRHLFHLFHLTSRWLLDHPSRSWDFRMEAMVSSWVSCWVTNTSSENDAENDANQDELQDLNSQRNNMK